MYLHRLRFDRVFSVSRHHTKWGKWTQFGFESGAIKVYGASVYGHPDIPANVELDIAVPRASDWKNISGWSIITTGEVVVAKELSGFSATAVLFVAFLLTMAVLYLSRFPDLNMGQHLWFALALLGVSSVFIFDLRRSFRIRAAYRVLSAR
jgi:hypothetical protein